MEAFDVFKWIYTIGGVGLLIAAVMGLMDAFSNLDRDTVFAELVASAYAFWIGVYAILLETPYVGKDSYTAFFTTARLKLHAQLNCLRYLWGRSLMYVVGSLLAMVQQGLGSVHVVHAVFGAYMFMVAIVGFSYGIYMKCQLLKVKEDIMSENDLVTRFDKIAANEDYIPRQNFPTLLKEFNIELDYVTLTETLNEMDLNQDGVISLDEFRRWYSERLLKLPSVMENDDSKGGTTVYDPESNKGSSVKA